MAEPPPPKRPKGGGSASQQPVLELQSPTPTEPSALAQMLAPSSLTPAEFFATVWGAAPRVFRCGERPTQVPLHRFGGGLLAALDAAVALGPPSAARPAGALVMRNGMPTADYAASPHAAYLDGCSIVVNHLEASCEAVRALCAGLREDFPHAYANSYLTPPGSQAVAPHADDRDVLVWQCAGRKRWKVYKDPPVQLPFTREQVGKSELYSVPEETLDAANLLLETTLLPGDVLYMPRGWVHEAATVESEGSLHLTLALATQDWAWSSLAAAAMARAGASDADVAAFRADVEATSGGEDWASGGKQRARSLRWRASAPPALVCSGAPEAARRAADAAAAAMAAADGRLVARGIGAAELRRELHEKRTLHNERQDQLRPAGGGAAAAWCLCEESFVRRLSEEEKRQKAEAEEQKRQEREQDGAGAAAPPPQQQQGLQAREGVEPTMHAILAALITSPTQVHTYNDPSCEFLK